MKQRIAQTMSLPTLFPSILRFITEYRFSQAQSKNIKVYLVSGISLFLITLIFLQGVVLWHQINQQKYLLAEYTRLQKEVTYWESVADKYKGYRDVYFRIASLQYKLGNIEKAQIYVKKALELDPNSPDAHVLGVKVGVTK